MSEYAARSVLERMNMREVALAPHYAGLVSDLRQMSTANAEEANAAFMARRADLCAAYGFSAPEQRKPFAFAGGLAIIPVSGTLINRFGQSWGFVTGYNFIRSQLNMALADEDVKGIVLDLNSPGGEVSGCFEVAEDIFAAREQKPILGVVDASCYSACYAIGSACERLVVTPSGGAGSIGVVAMHVDVSKMYEDFGVKVTFIHSGAHKVDGNPYEALSDDVRADIQARVDATREKFAGIVARNRNMDTKAVLDTEARVYRAEDAVGLGLADAISAPHEAVRAFFDELSGSKTKEQDDMSTEATKPGEAAKDSPQVDQQAVAAQARSDERARVSGIMGCEEAKGRGQLANHLALNTDLSVDAAKGILAAAPAEAAPAAPAPAANANPFKAAMDADQHPQVGVDGGGGSGGGDDPGEAPHLAILRAQEQATGLKLVTK